MKLVHKINPQAPQTWLKPDEKLMCGQFDIAWMYVIFAYVDGYEGYKIDSEGRAWSCWESYWGIGFRGKRKRISSNWKLLNISIDKDGYHKIGIRKNNEKGMYCCIHTLVLENMYCKRPGSNQKIHARHLNRDKNNNRLINLLWGTISENVQDRVRSGRTYNGSGNPNSKLSDSNVLEIVRRRKNGESITVLSKEFCLHRTTVNKILSGKQWSHLTGVVSGNPPNTQ